MSSVDESPPDFQIVPIDGGGLRYVLPRRDLGRARWFGLVPIAFGLFACGFMIVWTAGWMHGIQQFLGPWGLLSGLVALPGFLGAATMIGLGLVILFGHAEIRLSNGRLQAIERVGWLRWKRSVRAEQVRRLLVAGAPVTDASGQPIGPPSFAKLAGLEAELSTGKDFWLTIGYPRRCLLVLANHLSAELQAMLSLESGTTEMLPPVAVVDVPLTPPGEIERLEQPADSLIEYQPLEDGFTLNVPARGLWQGSGGLYFFSLIWCGFMTVFTFITVNPIFAGKGNPQQLVEWGFIAFIVAFWLIGCGMMVASINMGRRRAALAVTDGVLMIVQTSLFGTTRNSWELAEIAAVRKGPSGMSVNDVPVMQLQIVPCEGKKFGLLTGRDEAELEWMATVLRRAVLPPVDLSAGPPSEVDRFEQPTGSLVEYQPLSNGCALNVSARGVWRGSAGLFAFSLIWLGFMSFFTAVSAESVLKWDGGGSLIWIAFLSLFWLVGLAMLIGAIDMGRRRAALAVSNGTLTIIQTSLFGTTRRDWDCKNVATVRMGPSGMQTNDIPVMQLHIVLHDGERYGLLTGREKPELEWIATVLRQAICNRD